MAKKKQTAPEAPPPTPTVTEADMIRAATNDPALSPLEFQVADKTFKIVDLEYGEYLKFVSLLKPLFTALGGKAGIAIPDIELKEKVGLEGILEYCAQDLPKLACIVCNATDKTVTPAWLMKHSNPVRLANIVLRQLFQNNMIADFADFFVQALPLLKAIQRL